MSAVAEKIAINFGWQGPTNNQRGSLEIGVIDLIFKDAKTAISVHIPDKISPTTLQRFSFTCRRYQGGELKETYPALLSVTLEQIHHLTIKAGIFEESPYKGPAMMDRSGRVTHEKRLLRSDREVKLELPQDLEIGEKYTLVITSNANLSLSARLVKKETATTTTSSTTEDDP